VHHWECCGTARSAIRSTRSCACRLVCWTTGHSACTADGAEGSQSSATTCSRASSSRSVSSLLAAAPRLLPKPPGSAASPCCQEAASHCQDGNGARPGTTSTSPNWECDAECASKCSCRFASQPGSQSAAKRSPHPAMLRRAAMPTLASAGLMREPGQAHSAHRRRAAGGEQSAASK
jgi:hypothetical protein